MGPLMWNGVPILRIVGDSEASKSTRLHAWIGGLGVGGMGWGFHVDVRNQGRGSMIVLVRVLGRGNFVRMLVVRG